jgi:hypothetical protein
LGFASSQKLEIGNGDGLGCEWMGWGLVVSIGADDEADEGIK